LTLLIFVNHPNAMAGLDPIIHVSRMRPNNKDSRLGAPSEQFGGKP